MSVAGPRGSPAAPRRTPAVLVTDTRETRPSTASNASRPQPTRQGTRVISVDNVLQYASEIPSAQRRAPPGTRPVVHTRTPSGRHPLEPKLRGVGVPLGGGGGGVVGGGVGGGVVHTPARSSKTSEKLVLLPEMSEEHEGEEKEGFEEEGEGDDAAPPSDEALARRRVVGGKGKSDAERLPKSARIADPQLARVTAYCTAQSFRLRSTAQFVREQHGARTKIYDEGLYCVYQLPLLLGGGDGYRVRSSPVVKNPGGRSVLDEQIEANERREYREGWHEESDEYSVRAAPAGEGGGAYVAPPSPAAGDRRREGEEEGREREERTTPTVTEQQQQDHPYANGGWAGGESEDAQRTDHERRESNTSSSAMSFPPSPQPAVSPDAHTVAELFIFSYGVAVLWNFTQNQEKDVLADLTFSSSSHNNMAVHPPTHGKIPATLLSSKTTTPFAPLPTTTPLPLMTRPLDEDDFETEEFHFQYDARAEKPRIYNDMITLRTSDHMIKLAMSHAIAQSTKLSFFEERMQRTMADAQYVPRRLALEGSLGMDRKEVVRLVGRLFEGRVDVNLSSNILETPNFFWDAEPTLHPLYGAVREYLEIKPRIQVLNERCRVFLDLAEILSDSIADVKMTRITWIIIVLIVVSILVTCTEVFLRFGILASQGGKGGGQAGAEVVRGALKGAVRRYKGSGMGVGSEL